jgi:hypothetical protein
VATALSWTDARCKDPVCKEEDLGRKDWGTQDEGPSSYGTPTAPAEQSAEAGGEMFGPDGLLQRIQAVAHGVVGSLPQALRAHAAVECDGGGLSRLIEAMTLWVRGIHLGLVEFAQRFFGRAPEDVLLEKLHGAVLDVVLATDHCELRQATEKVAFVMQAIGLDRWPRVLADAHRRAHDPETIAAIERPRGPPHSEDDSPQRVFRPLPSPGLDAAAFGGGGSPAGRGASGNFARQRSPRKSAQRPPGVGVEVPLNVLLAPIGKPVGVASAGAIPEVRTVSPAVRAEIQAQMLQGAAPASKPGYPERWYQRADGSFFGVRSSLGNGRTIDVADPNVGPEGVGPEGVGPEGVGPEGAGPEGAGKDDDPLA